MPRLKTETLGAGDQSWMASTEGKCEAPTGTLDLSAFTANTHYPDGYIMSGIPLGLIASSKLYAPFDTSETNGQEVHVGFLLTDQKVVGTADIPAPILVHGQVYTDKLPVAFDPTDDGVSPRFTYSEKG